MENNLINPSEFGIEPKKVNELMGNLPLIKEERSILESQYSEIMLLDIDDASTSKKARELRLKIQKNRTQGINIWHKEAKDFFLKGGQFVDAIKRMEVSINERMEENLEKIEKHAEIKEQERINNLRLDRIKQLESLIDYIPSTIDLGVISEEDFNNLKTGAKLQHENKLKAEKAEKERIEKEQKKRELSEQRKRELIPVWNFIEDKYQDFGLLSNAKFASIKKDAEAKKDNFEKEQQKIKEENEALRKQQEAERIANEKALEAEKQKRIEAEKQIKAQQEAERIANEKALEAERQKRIEAEKQIKAQQEAEELARIEAEKLAKSPEKDQLKAWVSSFNIQNPNIENEVSKNILDKFNSFKQWAISEIEKY